MHPLIEYFKRGETPKTGRVGIEVEHFVLDAQGKPLNYARLVPVLEAAAPFYERVGTEEGHLIALESPEALVTLEPGCQLELSFACTDDIAQISGWYEREAGRFRFLLEKEGARLVYSGGLPGVPVDQVERIPKRRYAFMERWFAFAGTRGKEMMKGTASVHVSVDYRDEKDFVRKVRAANILHPLLGFLMSNTRTYEGKPNEDVLLRDAIWNGTDGRRCGTIPHLFDEDFGYQSYADWLLDVPVILVQDRGQFFYEGPLTVREAGEKYGWDDAHIAHYVSMVFPDVRVKQFIEVRSADSVPQPFLEGYAALMKSLFYQDAVLDEVLSWTDRVEDLAGAKEVLRQDGFAAVVYGHRADELLERLLRLASDGLPVSEKEMLSCLESLVRKRKHIYEY